MKARLDGEDWNGLDTTLKEFAQLTPPAKFGERLAKLKDDAAHRAGEIEDCRFDKNRTGSDCRSSSDDRPLPGRRDVQRLRRRTRALAARARSEGQGRREESCPCRGEEGGTAGGGACQDRTCERGSSGDTWWAGPCAEAGDATFQVGCAVLSGAFGSGRRPAVPGDGGVGRPATERRDLIWPMFRSPRP